MERKNSLGRRERSGSRSSAVFYLDEEEEQDPDEAQEALEEDRPAPKTSSTADDTERYTAVAVRAKLSVEVEQRKRLGAWGKRVLVLDGSTLYAYKTKGDGGSVGGWEIGGADVHVGRGSDSTRDDGRHLLVIARPPAYKLTFSFNTTYEQARMIQALSSSGAVVTGLDAIMLMKNLKKQQDEEKEEEERRNRQEAEKEEEEDDDGEVVFIGSRTRSSTVNSMNNIDEKLSEEQTKQLESSEGRREEEDELEEISASIYDASTGVVSNPLYTSHINLAGEQKGGEDDTQSHESHDTSSFEASLSKPTTPQDADTQVNPLPKPPRVHLAEGSPTNDPNTEVQVKATNQGKTEVDESKITRQSSLDGGESRVCVTEPEKTAENRQIADKGVGATESKQNTKPEEEEEEGEGFYQVNSDSDNSAAKSDDDEVQGTDEDNAETAEALHKANLTEEELKNNYNYLISKMKLERGLLIDSLNNGTQQEIEALQAISPRLSPKEYSPSVSPTHNHEQSKKGSSSRDVEEPETDDKEWNSDNVDEEQMPSDSEEQFEQLYKHLNTDSASGEAVNGDLLIEITNENENAGNVIVKDETETSEDLVDSGTEPSRKRVNSIIKKKNSGQKPGPIKHVQFNLAVDDLDPSPDEKKVEASTKEAKVAESKKPKASDAVQKKETPSTPPSTKKADVSKAESPKKQKQKKESDATSSLAPSPSKKKKSSSSLSSQSSTKKSPEASLSSSTPASPKKKGIFSSIFNTSTKKSDVPSAKGEGKTTATPDVALKKQPVVDLTAPLIISGQVEVGGSVGGRVNGRRVEVRGGHLLAFLPRASTPISRVTLSALSVTPTLGSGPHPHSLVLTRASRVLMLLKLSSHEDMMLWLSVLSDEVIKNTPKDQRAGLTLYPSREDKQETKDVEKEEKQITTENVLEENKENIKGGDEVDYIEKPQASSKEQQQSEATKDEWKHPELRGTSGWPKGSTDAVDELPKRAVSVEDITKTPTDVLVTNKRRTTSESEEITLESVQSRSQVQKKIQQLNMLSSATKTVESKKPIPSRPYWTSSKVTEKQRQHTPLHRLSGQGLQSPSEDTVDNFLAVNTLPEKLQGQTKERISEYTRLVSSSESFLPAYIQAKKGVTDRTVKGNEKPEYYEHYGTHPPVRQSVKSKVQTTSIRDTLPTDAPDISPPDSPRLVSPQPREIKIVESKSQTVVTDRTSLGQSGLSDDEWMQKERSRSQQTTADVEPQEGTASRITWSVSATREKFELLCSVSGENKSGKLTTKTPISRKRSNRSSVKKRRSNEGTPTRRPTIKRHESAPLTSSSSQELRDSADYTDSFPQQPMYRLPPVKDIRKNFEGDRSSSTSPVASSSTDDLTAPKTSTKNLSPNKTPLKKTSNVLEKPLASEPAILLSRSFNVKSSPARASGDRLVRTPSPNHTTKNDVVVCWRGRYIAQETEQEILNNISNAFLAKRRLLSREVAAARIQERLSLLEERVWEIQAAMAQLDKGAVVTQKETREWRVLEKSLKATEEETSHWTARLAQIQREAEAARQKLASAVVSGLSQYSGSSSSFASPSSPSSSHPPSPFHHSSTPSPPSSRASTPTRNVSSSPRASSSALGLRRVQRESQGELRDEESAA